MVLAGALVSGASAQHEAERDYCSIDGKKQAYDWELTHGIGRENGKLECVQGGKKVVDLEFKGGRKTGFTVARDDSGSKRLSYRDSEFHGPTEIYKGRRLSKFIMYERGQPVWRKEYYDSGRLSLYWSWRTHVGFRQDEAGRVTMLKCEPDVGDEVILRELCGFEGAITTPIYSQSGEILKHETWKSGVLVKER